MGPGHTEGRGMDMYTPGFPLEAAGGPLLPPWESEIFVCTCVGSKIMYVYYKYLFDQWILLPPPTFFGHISETNTTYTYQQLYNICA